MFYARIPDKLIYIEKNIFVNGFYNWLNLSWWTVKTHHSPSIHFCDEIVVYFLFHVIYKLRSWQKQSIVFIQRVVSKKNIVFFTANFVTVDVVHAVLDWVFKVLHCCVHMIESVHVWKIAVKNKILFSWTGRMVWSLWLRMRSTRKTEFFEGCVAGFDRMKNQKLRAWLIFSDKSEYVSNAELSNDYQTNT